MNQNTVSPERDFNVRSAVMRCIGPNAAIEGPAPGGQYAGEAILVNDKYLVQQIGDKAIAHRRDALGTLPLDPEDAKRPYKLNGMPLSVQYDNAGRGTVALDFEGLAQRSVRMDEMEAEYAKPFNQPKAWDGEDVQETMIELKDRAGAKPRPAPQEAKPNALQSFVGAANTRHNSERAGRAAAASTAPAGRDFDV